jgi:hypothetical protein
MKIRKYGDQIVAIVGRVPHRIKRVGEAWIGERFYGYQNSTFFTYMVGANLGPHCFLGNHRNVKDHRLTDHEKNILNTCP